jgi:hypothetical protein
MMNIDKHVLGSKMNHSSIFMNCCLTNLNAKGSQTYDKICSNTKVYNIDYVKYTEFLLQTNVLL